MEKWIWIIIIALCVGVGLWGYAIACDDMPLPPHITGEIETPAHDPFNLAETPTEVQELWADNKDNIRLEQVTKTVLYGVSVTDLEVIDFVLEEYDLMAVAVLDKGSGEILYMWANDLGYASNDPTDVP